MDKDNKNSEVDNTDKKLHISDVMFSFNFLKYFIPIYLVVVFVNIFWINIVNLTPLYIIISVFYIFGYFRKHIWKN